MYWIRHNTLDHRLAKGGRWITRGPVIRYKQTLLSRADLRRMDNRRDCKRTTCMRVYQLTERLMGIR